MVDEIHAQCSAANEHVPLPCPLCKSQKIDVGFYYGLDSSSRAASFRCMECGCRAPKLAWDNRITDVAQPELLHALVDWTYLYALEGAAWPDHKTISDPLIRLAQERAPTQADADRFKAGEGLREAAQPPAAPVMEATQAQHVGRKGEPARFTRNGVLEICQCRECRDLPRSSAVTAGQWCQPMDNGEHASRKFLLYFEDADHGISVFDNKAEAREAFTKANTNWNCYLFGALPLSGIGCGSTPDRERVARALCKQYELDDGFSEEQAERASQSGMHRNFLKAADAAIAACTVTRPKGE